MIKSNTADAIVIAAGGGAASLNFMTVDNLLEVLGLIKE